MPEAVVNQRLYAKAHDSGVKPVEEKGVVLIGPGRRVWGSNT